MSKAIDSFRFARNVFHILDRKLFSVRLPMMAPTIKVKWTLANSVNAFTRPTSRKGVYVVNIGLLFPGILLGYGSRFADRTEAMKYVKAISWIFEALVYHEVGHLLYTDMTSNDIWGYKDPDYVYFISQLANVIEDFVIENYGMAKRFSFTKKYFAFLVKLCHLPSVAKYSDKGDMQSFLNFLLLKLRCGGPLKAAGKTNKVWDDNEKSLKPMLLDCLRETNAHERMLKCIRMAEWLIANVTSVDWKAPKPDSDTASGVGSMSSGVTGGSGTFPTSRMPTAPSKRGKASGSGSGGESDGVGSSNGNGQLQVETGDNTGSNHGDIDPKTVDDIDEGNDAECPDDYDPSNDVPIEDLPEVGESTSSILGGDDDHVFLDAKSYFIPNEFVVDEIDKLIDAESDVSNGIRIAFGKFTARIKPRFVGGFHSGRLDTRAVIRQQVGKVPDTKLFMKRVPRGLAPDVAFSILCDNSGSMSGNKSYVTTRAMIAFAKACDMCKLPCEINLFVDGITNTTITLKDFDESFAESKKYFGIAHSALCRNYTYDYSNIILFSGNIDEVNLFHVWERFKRNPHKDRIVIVISDGMTCGSTSDLANLVKRIGSEGGYVIGIGVQSKAVLNIYPHVKIFDSASSLEDLPAFMTNMVMNIVTGKE